MNMKILAISVFAILATGTLTVFLADKAYAYHGDYTQTGPNHTDEREDQMDEVMSNNDYEGWKKLMTEDGRNPGVLKKVDTQEKFDLFAEAYELGKAGKTDEANEIRSELGLGNGQGNRNGNGSGTGRMGQNNGGNYSDSNNNGICDMME